MKIITNLVAMVHTNIFWQVARRFPASRNKNTIPYKCSIIIALLLLFTCSLSYGQVNLVKNPSFEDYISCPTYRFNTSFASYWSAIVDTSYTADTNFINHGIYGSFVSWDANCFPYYCNICADTIVGDDAASLPMNGYFYHYPRTGNGLMHVYVYGQAGGGGGYGRQYLQGRLFTHLVAGQSYCVTFYVVNGQNSGVGCNHIGVYFDDGTIDTTTECGHAKTYITPQYQTDSIIADTTNWHKISFNFIASGIEKFVTFGDFNDSAHTDIIHFNSGGMAEDFYATYLFDDISVIASNATAYAGLDKWISPGDTTAIGLDSNGEGMPCYWYKLGELSVIDSGGTIQVHPTTTTTYTVAMDLCGTITYDTVTVHVVPLHSILLKMNNINIYPNPTKSEVTIVGAEGCDVVVYDIFGAVQSKVKTATAKEILDIGTLPNGIYCIELIDTETGMKVVKRIVKE
jgi:Secretion system C-terminal sorting domain